MVISEQYIIAIGTLLFSTLGAVIMFYINKVNDKLKQISETQIHNATLSTKVEFLEKNVEKLNTQITDVQSQLHNLITESHGATTDLLRTAMSNKEEISHIKSEISHFVRA